MLAAVQVVGISSTRMILDFNFAFSTSVTCEIQGTVIDATNMHRMNFIIGCLMFFFQFKKLVLISNTIITEESIK